MEQIKIAPAEDRAAVYRELLPQLKSLIEDEPDYVANAANLAAALKQALGYASWVGFYFNREGELVLGPFQGKVACTRIKMGSGVCGTAASEKKTLIVPNVYEFPGHIFCDPDSKSEIVIPIVEDGILIGVLDVDSSSYGSFNEVDAENLEAVAELFSAALRGKKHLGDDD